MPCQMYFNLGYRTFIAVTHIRTFIVKTLRHFLYENLSFSDTFIRVILTFVSGSFMGLSSSSKYFIKLDILNNLAMT